MSTNCSTGTNIPTLSESPCPSGEFFSTHCISNPEAITALGLPADSLLNEIINALVLSILYKNEQISTQQDLIDALTDRVTALENI